MNMKKSAILMLLAAMLLAVAPAWSQAVSAQVNGTVSDNGKPAPGLQVVLTNKDTGRTYKMKTDKNGKFDGVGIGFSNNYTLEVFSPSGESLFKRNGVIVNGEGGAAAIMTVDISNPTATNLGMSNEVGTKSAGGGAAAAGAGQPKYTKEQIEAIKAQNAKAQNMNGLITQAQNAMNAKQWQEAVAPLQQMIAADPNRWEFYQALGNSQLNLNQYDEAVQTFEKGIQVAEANTTVDPKNPQSDPVKKKAGEAQMLTNEGTAYLKLKKNPEAIAAFNKAASLDPNPGTAYFNLCATQYNNNNMEAAAVACDKAIQADPNKADAYFIKGSALYGNGKMDPNNKWQVPPGTTEALNKYLELAPDGPHANDVKAMLEAVGAKIEKSYKKK
jgi:tetratricopeptide (TPR) repeat protein